MANINDFKLIAKKSERYADLLLKRMPDSKVIKDEKQKERIGFYLFILENVCGVQDILDLKDFITDTEFNQQVLNEKKIDDQGVDAIYISEEESLIRLFNFKYREKFNPDKSQSPNEPFISTRFINALTTENTTALEGKLKIFADDIICKLNSSDEWKLYLHVVSNENIELNTSDENLRRLEEHYGLEVVPIGLT